PLRVGGKAPRNSSPENRGRGTARRAVVGAGRRAMKWEPRRIVRDRVMASAARDGGRARRRRGRRPGQWVRALAAPGGSARRRGEQKRIASRADRLLPHD